MNAFLQLVAQDLLQKYGRDLSRLVVVFPNKRAELFMNEYLLDGESDMPIWAPRYTTINRLFRSFSPLSINDPIDTACRLYHRYVALTGDNISLDLFYGWAERLLADFDDVDKSMADASSLFQNLNDIKNLEGTDFLTEEQVEVLKTFFADFSLEQRSELREKFRRLWEILLPLYEGLNAELSAEGLAYEGALYRSVVEALKKGEVEPEEMTERYVFVGFNVLDKVERELFAWLKKKEKAVFYWDYDEFYAPTGGESHFEAGMFLKENLIRFGNELSGEHFDNLRHIECVEMVAASTEVVQAQSVGTWLSENLTADPKRTAVVLCNENILQPLLHALPDNVTEVNVTKGFPLSHTEAATLVERRFADFERRKHPLSILEMLDDLIGLVNEQARLLSESEDFSEEGFEQVLQSEGCYLMSGLLNRLWSIAESGRLNLNTVVLRRVVRQIMRQTTIPFQGEPAVGLQVMGVLETRCLDFENIVMLSVNEGVLPQKNSDNSFIPYVLRRAFELTTPERRTAVYAYYFYRLIQRARKLRLLYNSSSEGMVQGEMSRFMTQLMVESKLPIRHLVLTTRQETKITNPRPVEKPPHLPDLLTSSSKHRRHPGIPYLSPSAVNTYLRCQLLFYYQYVAKFREPTPDKDDIQPNTLGTIFHNAAEQIYQDFLKEKEGWVEPGELALLSKDSERLQHYIRHAFLTAEVDYQILEANVVEMYLRSLLEHDRKLGTFRIVGTERSASMRLALPKSSAIDSVEIGGVIDRIDIVEHEAGKLLRIVDYKTGGKVESAKSIEEVFEIRGGKQKHYMLQTFIYSQMMTEAERLPAHPLAPALFFVNHARQKDYSPYIEVAKQPILDFEHELPEFKEKLSALVAEIFDPSTDFTPIEDEPNVCKTCKYFSLCYQ